MRCTIQCKNILLTLLDLVYPEKCEFCKEKIFANKYICDNCAKKILQKSSGRSRNCTYMYDIIYIARYSEIKREILRYKFNDQKYLGKIFIALFLQRIQIAKIEFDYITSVPLSKEKMKRRGYNQSEYIAKEVAKCYNKKYVDVLCKVKDNPNQSSMHSKNREKNVDGVFLARNVDMLEGKTLLLVDDVYTTGATATACVEEIRRQVNCNVIIGIIAMNNKKIMR